MKNFYFVSQSKTYKYERSGEGTPKYIHPWKIEEKDLTVSSITYSYKVT